MIKKSVEHQGIKISVIFNEAIKLYKTNYKLFLKITVISFLIKTFTNAFNNFGNSFKMNNPILSLIYHLLSFIILTVLIYYGTKFSIALYASISERYKDKDMDIKGALSIAAEKFWRFVGVGLQLLLILIIPASIAMLSFFLVKNLIMKYVLVSIFSFIVIYLYTIYEFAPLMAIFEKDKAKYFTMSKQMIQGDFIRIVFLTVALPAVFLVPIYTYYYIFNDRTTMIPLNNFVFTTINNLFSIFITPFTTSLSVVLYYKLIRIKRIGVEKPHKKKWMTRLMKMKF